MCSHDGVCGKSTSLRLGHRAKRPQGMNPRSYKGFVRPIAWEDRQFHELELLRRGTVGSEHKSISRYQTKLEE